VQVVFMTDRTGNTRYQTPRQNEPQNFRAKLDATMKLIQCFTAEQMNDLGFGRLTFNLEWDKDGNVEVRKLVSEHPAEFFYPLADVPLFLAVRSEDGGQPRVTASGNGGDILIESEHGLAYLGIDAKDEAVGYKSWGYGQPAPPRRYLLTAAELQQLAGTTDVRIRAVDLEGQQSEAATKKLARK
jgi:hypothetical protein